MDVTLLVLFDKLARAELLSNNKKQIKYFFYRKAVTFAHESPAHRLIIWHCCESKFRHHLALQLHREWGNQLRSERNLFMSFRFLNWFVRQATITHLSTMVVSLKFKSVNVKHSRDCSCFSNLKKGQALYGQYQFES